MITVALGGGRTHFLPARERDPEYTRLRGSRGDRQNLITKWLDKERAKGLNARYVWNQTEFDDVDPVTTDRLLGLFQPQDMWMEVDRLRIDGAGEPSLAEMTEKAIRILQKNSNGYFLLVEGGRIDHAHHLTNAYGALHDMVAFDNAVAKAVDLTSDSDTLIIVTADHSHTFSLGGYSDRGNSIFGLAVTGGKVNLAEDNKPYTSLLYGNGFGYQGRGSKVNDPHLRTNITDIHTEGRLYLQQSAVPLASETHAGEDVAIFARGPMSHLIHGVHQQSYIAYVMRYASCIGSDLRHCGDEGSGEEISPESTTTSHAVSPTTHTQPQQSSTGSSFLGMGLDTTETAVALNLLFTLLVCMFVFAVVMSCVAVRSLKNGCNKTVRPSQSYGML